MLIAEAFADQPQISTPSLDTPNLAKSSTALLRQVPERYVPERGLVRRIRTAQANDSISELAERHALDSETRKQLSAELIKSGAPPITHEAAEKALSRFVSFEPLNVDALKPFILLSAERSLRAHALAQIGLAMHSAGRSVKLVSDASDIRQNEVLVKAGQEIGCGVIPFDGVPNCVDILRNSDLACMNIVEAGFRAPLDKIALLRLTTIVNATGAEPVAVIRTDDAPIAASLSRVGVKRVVLVHNDGPTKLGPVLTALREANLAIAELLHIRNGTANLRPAKADSLAKLLV